VHPSGSATPAGTGRTDDQTGRVDCRSGDTADPGGPAGKLADLELHFTDWALAVLKLLGFTLWEGRGVRGPNVSLFARSYVVNGERRSFNLLRPSGDEQTQETLREALSALCLAEMPAASDR